MVNKYFDFGYGLQDTKTGYWFSEFRNGKPHFVPRTTSVARTKDDAYRLKTRLYHTNDLWAYLEVESVTTLMKPLLGGEV